MRETSRLVLFAFYEKSHDGSQSVPFIGPFRVQAFAMEFSNFCICVNAADVDSPMGLCAWERRSFHMRAFLITVSAPSHMNRTYRSRNQHFHMQAHALHALPSGRVNIPLFLHSKLSFIDFHFDFSITFVVWMRWMKRGDARKTCKNVQMDLFFSTTPFFKTLVNGNVGCSRCSSQCKMK